MRICLVYDCLFPYTIGGAERRCRRLAERVAAEGHDVTYLTLRQWPRGEAPNLSGVRVVAAGPQMELYTGGRRRILPPLVFGAGVLGHLLRHGRAYDVVHTASFPYFSLLACAATRRLGRFRLVVDWHEVWTRAYWQRYLGPVRGWLGWRVQRLCMRAHQRAFCFSALHARRLREEGYSGSIAVLEGAYDGPLEPAEPRSPEPLIVFAGRHIPEKRVPAIIPALARARERLPDLRCEIYGDGPERAAVERLIDEHGLRGAAEVKGFVDGNEVDKALARALCLMLPSQREGYGLVVVEAAARGTPSVVVRDPDNAATELVEEGANGVIAPSASPEDLASAVLRVHAGGAQLRAATATWFKHNATRLSLASSLDVVAASYRE